MRRVVGVMVLSVLAVVTARGAADEIRLQDGSLVRGTITGIADGKVTIATDFAGDVTIALDKVTGMVSDEAHDFRLDRGEVVSGRLDVVDGQQRVTRDGTVWYVTPPALVAMGAPKKLLAAGEKPPANWKGRAEFGLKGESGNTDRLNVQGRVTTTRETEADRLTLYLRGEYETQEGNRTANEVIGGTRYERDLNDRLFAFARLELEYDEFEDLDLRSILSGGLGYFFIRSDRQELKGRAGLGYTHESFSDGTRTDNLVAEFGYDYRLDIRKWLRYTSDFTYYLPLTEVNDWRFTAENAGEIPIGDTEAWKLRFGVHNDYDNAPQPGVESLDTMYFTSLVYNWK